MNNELLPFDLTEIVANELEKGRRANDGLMHASSHINGSLRHAQLDVAGAPTIERALVGEFALWIGTMMHNWLHNTLRDIGIPYMAEVNVTPWMPRGWGGTADFVVWNPELKGFVLVDFKSQKGEGMRFIERGGAKEDHIYQASAYWHALRNMGLPMVEKAAVFYMPKNETRGKDDIVLPVLADFAPIRAETLTARMVERRAAVDSYLDSLPASNPHPRQLEDYVTDALAPVQEREQRIFFEKDTHTWTVKLMPHWSTAYCPYDSELCNCSDQGQTKIGIFDVDGTTYIARKGYEDVHPTVFPEP